MTKTAIAVLLDHLVPGEGGWPAASDAIADPASVSGQLARADQAWLEARALALLSVPAAARVDALKRLEAAEPGPFGRVLQALYQAYYNTEGAQAQVSRLAEAGPREDSPFFDLSLLDRVIATQAGRRRL